MGSAATITMAMTALCFSKSNKLTSSSFRTFPRLICSLSSSSSPKFNISFSPSKPKPKPEPKTNSPAQFDNDDDGDGGGELLIPWIVRGEDGNLKLQSEPPPSFLKAVANAQTGTKKSDKDKITNKTAKKKNEKENKVHVVSSSTSPPQYSKAARRFYNENFKDSGTRLSKVLAASGGDILLPITITFCI